MLQLTLMVTRRLIPPKRSCHRREGARCRIHDPSLHSPAAAQRRLCLEKLPSRRTMIRRTKTNVQSHCHQTNKRIMHAPSQTVQATVASQVAAANLHIRTSIMKACGRHRRTELQRTRVRLTSRCISSENGGAPRPLQTCWRLECRFVKLARAAQTIPMAFYPPHMRTWSTRSTWTAKVWPRYSSTASFSRY